MRRPGRNARILAFGLPALLLGLILAVSFGPLVDEAPAVREARLGSDWQLLRPDGPGPHPAAVLLSGCDGVHDNMYFWAEALLRHGRAVLIVDSHGPRGLNADPVWRPICGGLVLRGDERAGDVAAALGFLARTPGVDASDVLLLGASHGAWAAMEFVRLARTGQTPPGLTGWPEPPDEALRHVSALVLLYPYCGLWNGAQPDGWRAAPPALMILAERDQVVSTPACLQRAEALRSTGSRIDVAIIPKANHGFDQAEKSPLSPLPFDADQRARAQAHALAFLDSLDL